MSAEVFANVTRDCQQRGVKRLVMVMIADEIGSNGYAEIDHATLASKCACSEATVSAYCRQLAKDGEIEYEPGTGAGVASRFWLPKYAAEKVVKVVPGYGVTEHNTPERSYQDTGFSEPTRHNTPERSYPRTTFPPGDSYISRLTNTNTPLTPQDSNDFDDAVELALADLFPFRTRTGPNMPAGWMRECQRLLSERFRDDAATACAFVAQLPSIERWKYRPFTDENKVPNWLGAVLIDAKHKTAAVVDWGV